MFGGVTLLEQRLHLLKKHIDGHDHLGVTNNM
jgi:hypothetical protein